MLRSLNDAEQAVVSKALAQLWLSDEDADAHEAFERALSDAGIISTPFGYRGVEQAAKSNSNVRA